MQKVKLGVLLVGVSDLNKARPFYENVFGIKVTDFRPPFMQGELGNIEFNIEENAPYRSSDWGIKNIGNRKSFTFQVGDIFKFLEDAEKAGAKVVEKPIKQEWGWYDAVIADMDGNEFVIEQEIN
ncbi:MAG: VOC family protein [Patescibacteria group bacterium]